MQHKCCFFFSVTSIRPPAAPDSPYLAHAYRPRSAPHPCGGGSSLHSREYRREIQERSSAAWLTPIAHPPCLLTPAFCLLTSNIRQAEHPTCSNIRSEHSAPGARPDPRSWPYHAGKAKKRNEPKTAPRPPQALARSRLAPPLPPTTHRSAFLAPPRPLTRAAGPTTPERRKDETKPTCLPVPRPRTRAADPTVPERQKNETKPTPAPPPRPLTRGAGPTMPESQKDETKPRPVPPPRARTRAAGPTTPDRRKSETNPTPAPARPER